MSNSQKLCHDPNGGLPRLLEIMARLRNPETGCPWDIEQTYNQQNHLSFCMFNNLPVPIVFNSNLDKTFSLQVGFK